MKKTIYLIFLSIFLNNPGHSLEMFCKFEEVYKDGSVQNGILITKDKMLRYEYFKPSLYTIIAKNDDFFLIKNDNTSIVQKAEKNSEILKIFKDIIDSYPNIKQDYTVNNVFVKTFKDSSNFINRLTIKSDSLNLNIYFLDCNHIQIDRKYFRHFNIEKFKY